MNNKNGMPMLLLLGACLAAGHALAGTVAGDVVYEKTDTFSGAVRLSDGFMIDTAGVYQATLTDFENPNAFTASSLNVATRTETLGALAGPGMVTFEAGPGDYSVDLFAEVGHPLSAEEKQKMIDEEQRRRGHDWWHSLSKEEQQARKDLWRSWTKEEMEAHQDKVRRRMERWVAAQIDTMSLGQYGVQIAFIEGGVVGGLPSAGSPVPLPAAIWLFSAGILGLAGLAHRSAGR